MTERHGASPVPPNAEAVKGQVRATFDRLAPLYDTEGPSWFAHYGQRLVDTVGVEPGQRVLDVATGRGAVLFAAAERAGQSGEVIGVDLAEGMVLATRAEAARRGLPVRVEVMDAEHLDFPDGAFDRVFCGFGVMFFPDQAGTLRELRRVLRSGGRLGVSTWRRSQAEDLAEVLRALGLGGAGEPGWIGDPEALGRLLDQAGFQDVHVQTSTATRPYADVDQYWRSAQGTGLRRFLDQLIPEQRDQVRTALTERLRPQSGDRGVLVETVALLGTASG